LTQSGPIGRNREEGCDKVNGVQPAGALALVGAGRAGTAIAAALVEQGWRVVAVAGRSPDTPSTQAAARRFEAPAVAVQDAAHDADLVIVATPDAAIDETAAALAATLRPDALVVHLSGARGLDALTAVTARIGALHPLQTMPSTDAGHASLAGSWCAVAGDPEVRDLAVSMGLRPVEVDDEDRVRYHAAACIASNHLVALLDEVARVSPIPLGAFVPLVLASVENVSTLGAKAALTGPVARGDVETVRHHLDALPEMDRDAYRELARLAHALSGRVDPALDAVLR
jgi:predicted short-subunit dehydrogenase-like oxidoreductase (DUF2520 family)